MRRTNVHHHNKSAVQGPFDQRNTTCHNHIRPRHYASAACSSDCSASNKDLGARRHATYQTSEFEDAEPAKESPFRIQHIVYASVRWQKGAVSDEICARVPANIVVGVELICDMRDCLEILRQGVSRNGGGGNCIADLLLL